MLVTLQDILKAKEREMVSVLSGTKDAALLEISVVIFMKKYHTVDLTEAVGKKTVGSSTQEVNLVPLLHHHLRPLLFQKEEVDHTFGSEQKSFLS